MLLGGIPRTLAWRPTLWTLRLDLYLLSVLPGHLRFGCWFAPGITLLIVVLDATLPPLYPSGSDCDRPFPPPPVHHTVPCATTLLSDARRTTPTNSTSHSVDGASGRDCPRPRLPVEPWHSLHLTDVPPDDSTFLPSFAPYAALLSFPPHAFHCRDHVLHCHYDTGLQVSLSFGT
jgi:hypothetical protein